MEETNSREDLLGNVLKQSSMRPSGSLKSTVSGRLTPKSSPTFRRARTPRRESKGGSWRFQRYGGNRLVFWLILVTVWAYIGFLVQSKWAHSNSNKVEFVGYKSKVGTAVKVQGVAHTADSTVNDSTSYSGGDLFISKGSKESGFKRINVSLARRRHSSIHQNTTTGKNGKRSTMESSVGSNTTVQPKVRMVDNTTSYTNDEIPRRNTSYGLLVGPFGKIEDRLLGWTAEKRKGTCDRASDFARLVGSKKFLLIFHELSMTGAPLSMMELATELLSCKASVAIVALSRKGGLLKELDRRGIKILKDKGRLSYRAAKRADLIVAGSAVCSAWIEQYLSYFKAGSRQIVWWIMENRREYFDRSKHLLNQVKMLTFLSESQSKQWLTWCREEDILLPASPTIVPLSVNDELAFVAGIHCPFNTPSFTVDKMQEKRNLLRLAVRKEMGLAQDDMLVMSLSSINPGKGQHLLLESVLVMSEHNVSLVDVELNTLVKVENLSGTTIVDTKKQHPRTLSEVGKELEDSLRGNNETDSMVKKRIHPRLDRLLSLGNFTKNAVYGNPYKSRNLLSQGEVGTKPALRVLIGSVGSKSNKVPYVKGMLKFLSQHSNLSKILLWTPATTRVSSLYAAADVYVINAQGIGETFGRVTIEAMAFGLPVLGTYAGGTREIVEEKVTGLLHPVGREGTRLLAQNLQFLLRNPSAREQLGKNGRSKVEKMYMKQHMYKKLAEVFTQCMKIK